MLPRGNEDPPLTILTKLAGSPSHSPFSMIFNLVSGLILSYFITNLLIDTSTTFSRRQIQATGRALKWTASIARTNASVEAYIFAPPLLEALFQDMRGPGEYVCYLSFGHQRELAKVASPIRLRAASIIVATLPQSKTNSFRRRPTVPINTKMNAVNFMISPFKSLPPISF
jgi:hypothetical protein